jgi:hypothetical protein
VEGADVGRAVAEERHRYLVRCHAVSPTRRHRPRSAGATDDRVRAKHSPISFGRCIEPPLALHSPVALAHQLRQTLGRRGATGNRMVVAAIGREHVIVFPQGRAAPTATAS